MDRAGWGRREDVWIWLGQVDTEDWASVEDGHRDPSLECGDRSRG